MQITSVLMIFGVLPASGGVLYLNGYDATNGSLIKLNVDTRTTIWSRNIGCHVASCSYLESNSLILAGTGASER